MAIKIIMSVAMLFLMMLPGVFIRKFKLAGEDFGKGVSNLILFIASPALVLYAYFRDFNGEIMKTAVWVFVFAMLAHTLFTVFAFLLFKGARDDLRRVLRFAVVFANAGYMGMPLIEAALGPEAVLYASIYNISFNIFQWSLGVYIFENNSRLDIKRLLKKVLTHPCTIAAALGLIIFSTSTHVYIPEILKDAVAMLKNLVAPLSMLVIGIRLAELDFKSLKDTLTDKYAYLCLFLRHLFMPFLVVLILKLLSLVLPISDTVIAVMAILSSTPAATATVMFPERYDGNARYASKIVAISTLLSILTMPLIILISGV